ncbi:ankyrin repeat and MYND domain-containing protein 1 isoform X2 [Pundamilia nyererei]|uniref:Ankyrin repeat and MYND domain-containing protein 1 isoform X2 n=1 Tax=Pundamilia nyererei TaxID=303518 RepID=A0A9Y3VGV8_9CICH|nr:PREDICTED: ankyrin repeat and MYND domain-containing protein 1 isoform X2 [Pundamilia nyererei]
MLSTTFTGVAPAAGRGGAEPVTTPGSVRQSNDRGGARVGREISEGIGVQEWPDGSKYEGESINGLKHGKGRYSWTNGEYYEGSFYKDYKHGDGLYCWPTGQKFIGKFYLNRREGYGQQVFSDGAVFQGLYHMDQRFGPGVLKYPDGREDVGLWLKDQLLRLCTPLEERFSLKNFPEYSAYMDPSVTAKSPTQSISGSLQQQKRTHSEEDEDRDVLLDEIFIYPPGMESYSTDGDHLPLPPGRRTELDRHFYGKLWEPDAHPYQGYARDPLSTMPLQARLQAHIHNHRLQAENVGWDTAAVLSMNRDSFGPKGPLEVSSELLIQHSSKGDLHAVSQILKTGLVYPDVADSHGHTALIAATVNCHNDVIHLLLDMGVDIDKMNCEGMSALAVCHVLYYPFQSLHITGAEPPARNQISQVDLNMDTSLINNLSDQSIEPTEHISLLNRKASSDSELLSERRVGLNDCVAQAEHTQGEPRTEEREDRHCEETESMRNKGKQRKTESRYDQRRERGHGKNLTSKQSFDSTCCLRSYEIQVTDKMIQLAAEALSRTGVSMLCSTQETVRKMAAMKIEHRIRLGTMKLLLDRGADPNAARIPMPVLFLAIMAADTENVRKLLLCGARTDIPLPPERKGLYPLHVAAALPGPAGPRITQLLLHAITDPDVRACDQDEIYEPDKISTKATETLTTSPHLKEGGRTALHFACQRESDYRNASEVVAILLSHRASTDLLWSGHSPLSLAIASGNDMAVDELLNGGADLNLPLGWRVGSALCALTNINYHLVGHRIKLLDTLTKAGADILMPVTVCGIVGTAVDYARYSFKQDSHIAYTPFHALSIRERKIFEARQKLLSKMEDLMRQVAAERETGDLSSNKALARNKSLPEETQEHRKPVLKFCFHCGRSVSMNLTPGRRCNKVSYCSRACKLNSWEERHKKESVQVSASVDSAQKSAVSKTQRSPRALSAILKSKTAPRPLSVQFKSQRELKLLSKAEKKLESQNPLNLRENYSHN